MKAEILLKTPVSITLEVVSTNSPFYNVNDEYYQVFLNGILKLETPHNVFSLYNLEPDKDYEVEIKYNGDSTKVNFRTPAVSETKIIDPCDNLNEIVNSLKPNSLLILKEGDYPIVQLFLKSNITLYIKKKARLVASTDRTKYKVIQPIMNSKPYGTWEGAPYKSFGGIVTCMDVENVNVVGEGTIDGNAQNGDWWINHKDIRIAARPNLIFTAHSTNISFEGLVIKNSPSWTIHPFYSDGINILNLRIKNPKTSPNTDGCDPDSSTNVKIIGCHFSVGDDCIAIKSGKFDMVEKYYRPADSITIRNCLMQDGHGGVVLGSELSCGVTNLSVSKCFFKNTDRGIRVKTRRGRGEKAIVDDVLFENIYMEKVLNPFVVNMYYNCDADGHEQYVQSKSPRLVDNRTPYIGNITFRNIKCEDTISSCVFVYGLPEKKVKKIKFENVEINMANSNIYTYPAMMDGIKVVNRLGAYFNNVEEIEMKDVRISGQKGEEIILKNIDKIVRN